MTCKKEHSPLAAVLILGHGSPVSKANHTLHEVAKSVKEKGGYDIVQPAFLQFEHPDFSEAVDILVKQGAEKIIVHPYFLYMGSHVTKDLPFEIDTAVKKYPNLKFFLAPHLGYHEKLVDVAIERIEQIMGHGKNKSTPCPLPLAPVFQHPIEAESFKIIGGQLDESRFDAMELPIVKRLVHTTADFEYADLVRFGNNAIKAGIDAISRGADIITDVRMVEVGINKERFSKFGGHIRCFAADADVIAQAQKDNITKTSAAMRKALEYIYNNIVVIGNAPTALLELIKIIKEAEARPAVVVGVPVGFVGAEESKEELMKLNIPYISIKGKKGGSTIAVAIVNALLMMAEEKHAHT